MGWGCGLFEKEQESKLLGLSAGAFCRSAERVLKLELAVSASREIHLEGLSVFEKQAKRIHTGYFSRNPSKVANLSDSMGRSFQVASLD